MTGPEQGSDRVVEITRSDYRLLTVKGVYWVIVSIALYLTFMIRDIVGLASGDNSRSYNMAFIIIDAVFIILHMIVSYLMYRTSNEGFNGEFGNTYDYLLIALMSLILFAEAVKASADIALLTRDVVSNVDKSDIIADVLVCFISLYIIANYYLNRKISRRETVRETMPLLETPTTSERSEPRSTVPVLGSRGGLVG